MPGVRRGQDAEQCVLPLVLSVIAETDAKESLEAVRAWIRWRIRGSVLLAQGSTETEATRKFILMVIGGAFEEAGSST